MLKLDRSLDERRYGVRVGLAGVLIFAWASASAQEPHAPAPALQNLTPPEIKIVEPLPPTSGRAATFVEGLSAHRGAFPVILGQSRVLTVEKDLRAGEIPGPEIAVGDPDFLRYKAVGSHHVWLSGLKLGVTDLSIVTPSISSFVYDLCSRDKGDIVDPIELAIRHRLTPEMTALDVGANRGRYAMIMARVCRTVIAFEPQPELAKALAASAPENLKVECLAISDQPGTAKFWIDTRPDMSGVASSLLKLNGLHRIGTVREVEVATVTLDAYCRDNGIRPDLIKIDAEGWEPSVLAGASTLIEVVRPCLLFEFWESQYQRLAPWFEKLSASHFLVRACDGEPVCEWYAKNAGLGSTDVLAIPRPAHVGANRATHEHPCSRWLSRTLAGIRGRSSAPNLRLDDPLRIEDQDRC